MYLPNLITDLALILLVASITTIIFKMIKQPLVLGYIVAGFLVGPYFTVLPTVADMENIKIWSEIGIICLMFALGLEFSFHKLANVGGTAIITAVTEACGMFLFGYATGHILGWSVLDSVILGGILSMSSTTIIIKAFEELNLLGKKFTEIVFGVLIVEDIVGIFMMVFMSTFALSMGSGGNGNVIATIATLLFYLALWLILGIYVIPTLLKKAKGFMNEETLLLISLGICFGAVLLFSYIGFSTALGAFIAGSILAGTMFSEKIKHLITPIKDLFGAVFFISVGMLVDPAVLVNYALPILVITIATILGKLIFSSLGVLLSGQKLSTAVQCGSSLAQIGEFAFIIAALGMSLGMSSDFIYPVVVSVSVITTLTTPFFIKNGEGIFNIVRKLIPDKLYEKIESYTSDTQSKHEKDDHWKEFLKNYFISILGPVIIIIGIFELGVHYINPFLDNLMTPFGSRLVTTVAVLLGMAPFLGTLLRRQHDRNLTMLLIKSRTNLFPLFAFTVLRVAIAVAPVVFTLNRFMGISMIWLILPSFIFAILISRSDWLTGRYLEIEARFLANFNERVLYEQAELCKSDETHHSWLSEKLQVSEYTVRDDSAVSGRTLSELQWQRIYDVNIIKIVSGKKHINIPGGSQKLHAGDTIFLLGTKSQTEIFEYATRDRYKGLILQKDPVTLRDFICQDGKKDENQLFCYAITVNKDMHLNGKNIKGSRMRSDWNCDIIGIQRDQYPITCPDVQFIINNGDQIWLLGGYDMVGRLIMEGLIQEENPKPAESCDIGPEDSRQ